MRAGRLFEIIQMLRAAKAPLTAQAMAEALEVTRRTVYRDIASLQARRVPIEGAAGVGYVMRRGYDLPPVNFDEEEAEAVSLGLAMIGRTGDPGLQRAARRAAAKLSAATLLSETLYSSSWGPQMPEAVDLGALRGAIRAERKLALRYRDEAGAVTQRTVRPVGIVYYAETIVLAAWCELRGDFRHFRPDRFEAVRVLEERFVGEGEALRRDWAAVHLAGL